MSDEEEYSEEEEEEEEEEKPEVKKPVKVEEAPPKTEAELILEEKFNKKKNVDDDQWQEYIEQWRRQRAKEEEELRVLKEKQKKRRAARGEEEKYLIEKKKQEEEQRQREIEEKKMRDVEEKKRRLQEVERKRAAMMDAMKKNEAEQKPNFVVPTKRTDGGPGAAVGGSAMDKMLNVTAAKADLGKTKEQLAEDKKIALTFRVDPLEIEGMGLDQLKEKANQFWELIVKLETEKYDLEERQKRQDYDLKELAERQRQINRNTALKKGLDPEALSGKHPPKLQVASKYERRIDRRSYDDKKNLFNGGNEAQNEAVLEKIWNDRFMEFSSRKGKVPEWIPGAPPSKTTIADEDEPVEEEEEEEEEE